ncbi:MAG: hypothetical protein R2718_08815 [Solirubrobacterales bacterium]|nr:hypothetical protein [Solirubrobacterales bacterium]
MRKRGDSGRDRPRPARLEFRPILAGIVAGYRHDWRLLLGAGLMVFVPVALLTSLEPLDGFTIENWDGAATAGVILLIVTLATASLLGAVFYSGVVAAGEERRRHGVHHGLLDVARKLPYRNLILADLALVLVIAAGFLALVVPGFVFVVWFALIAPVVEIEGRNVRDSFRRSRQMVRPHFWRVAGVIFPLTILEAILEGVGDGLGHGLLGENYFGNVLGSVAANLLVSPLYALTVLALYFEIRARE